MLVDLAVCLRVSGGVISLSGRCEVGDVTMCWEMIGLCVVAVCLCGVCCCFDRVR